MASYQMLNALPAEAFLEPGNFISEFDSFSRNDAYEQEQYQTGLKISNASARVGVSVNGTWWADKMDGGYLSSYEGIGYHAHTAALWRGVLDGTAEIVIYRLNGGKITETVIRPSKKG